MKAFFKSVISLALVLAMVFTMSGCKFGGFDYLSFYMIKKITDENISEIETNIDSKTMDNSSYNNYQATYEYDREPLDGAYDSKENVKMQVNGEAQVGEVFAYIEWNSFSEYKDGTVIKDYTIKFCIVRVSDGENYSDYAVAVNVGDERYGATFSEMKDTIRNVDTSFELPANQSMLSALELDQYNRNQYFETLIEYADIVAGLDISYCTPSNPLIYSLHDLNKGDFLDTLDELNPNSTRGYTLYASGDSKFKIARMYNDNQTKEKYDNASYLKIHDDGTYSYKYIGEYTSNPGRNFKSETEQELKPFNGAIEMPSWIEAQ